MPQHELELPALLSDTPLGFLAAIGVLHLTAPALDQPPRLSWRGPAAPAVLHTHRPLTHDELTDILIAQLPDAPEDEPLPQAPGILSLKRHSPSGPSDPLRMPIELALQHLRGHARAERDQGLDTAHWFAALTNQLHMDRGKERGKKKESQPAKDTTWYATTTPLFGRTGGSTIANSWALAIKNLGWTKSARKKETTPQRVRDSLLGALTLWERVDGYAGANLDHFSTGDAHMVSTGEASQSGVPGATWLALHGFSAFRLTGSTRTSRTTGWDHTTPNGALTWPVWSPPLTATALTTLLEHPLARAPNPDPAQLHNLGVTAIYAAHRTRLSQGFGPLQPGQPIHQAPLRNLR
ncbi:hypothetical protein ACIBK8_19020 [Streptomyces sp. NPDC050161]|uniref:type I-G CRISPR-associated protein, Cas3-extension family n=1 Tax=Streptomyces sp. NPDC050161 TaxID=3365604 RepID=UPI0037B291E6